MMLMNIPTANKVALLLLRRRKNVIRWPSSSSSIIVLRSTSTSTTNNTSTNSPSQQISNDTSTVTTDAGSNRRPTISPIDANTTSSTERRRLINQSPPPPEARPFRRREDVSDGPVRSKHPVVLTPGRFLEQRLQQHQGSPTPTHDTTSTPSGDAFPKWGKHRSSSSNSSSTNNKNLKHGGEMTTLPTLHAHALLDPKSYCRQPGSTINGSRAAQSLIQGRQTLLRTMQHELFQKGDDEGDDKKESTTSTSASARHSQNRHRQEAYVLQGHGVPPQLLQHVLDMADALLRQQHVHGFGTSSSPTCEISFQNFHGQLDFEWMRIRSRSGRNHALPWSHMLHQFSGTISTLDMELYLTIMNRLACHLSLCLTPPPTPTTTMLDHGNQQKDDSSFSLDDDDDDEFAPTTTTTTIPARPNHWSVDMGRAWHYPPPLIGNHHLGTGSSTSTCSSSSALEPTVIVEWTPRQGLPAPGHVCLRLQGYPSSSFVATEASNPRKRRRRRRRLPVSMVFDACFRYP